MVSIENKCTKLVSNLQNRREVLTTRENFEEGVILLPYFENGKPMGIEDIKNNGYITMQEIKQNLVVLSDKETHSMCLDFIKRKVDKYRIGEGKGLRYYYNRHEVEVAISCFENGDLMPFLYVQKGEEIKRQGYYSELDLRLRVIEQLNKLDLGWNKSVILNKEMLYMLGSVGIGKKFVEEEVFYNKKDVEKYLGIFYYKYKKQGSC